VGKKKKPGEPQTLKEYTLTDHKVVRTGVVSQRSTFLRWAYDLMINRWDRYEVKTATPTKEHLFNFIVPVGKLGDLLVLDNYGDEVLPDKIRRPVMTTKMFHETIGIFRKTGQVVRVGFIKEKIQHIGCPEEGDPGSEEWEYSLTFWGLDLNGAGDPLYLPKKYLARLDELKSRKRPFYITLWENALYSFITRDTGYDAFDKALVIDFHFDGLRLQVWGDSYREVSDWDRNDNPWYEGK
jgi:hypothetical protein